MQIVVETTDDLTHLLPDGAQDGRTVLALPDVASPSQALEALGIEQDRGLLIIVNEAIVPKAQRDTHELSDGDVMQILPPLKGG